MKKIVALFTVLTICGVIGGSLLTNSHLQPVAEHGVVPGSDVVTYTAL